MYISGTWPDNINDSTDSEDSEKDVNVQTTAGSFNSSETRTKPFFKKKDTMHVPVLRPAGSTVKLKCISDGNPYPNITWQKNGASIERQLGVVKKNKWTITLDNAVTSDGGNYTCIVCNSEGCISYTYKVAVIGMYSA